MSEETKIECLKIAYSITIQASNFSIDVLNGVYQELIKIIMKKEQLIKLECLDRAIRIHDKLAFETNINVGEKKPTTDEIVETAKKFEKYLTT